MYLAKVDKTNICDCIIKAISMNSGRNLKFNNAFKIMSYRMLAR